MFFMKEVGIRSSMKISKFSARQAESASAFNAPNKITTRFPYPGNE